MILQFKRFSMAAVAFSGLLALTACSGNTPPSSNVANPSNASSAASTSAQASSGPVSLEKVQALVGTASHGTVQVQSVFKGRDGMTGAVTSAANRPKEIVWVSPNGEVLFPGPAFTLDGHNLSVDALTEQHVYITPDELAAKTLSDGQTFVVGSKGPILTAFMDPNCVWCHELYKNIMPLVKDGQLRVRFVMVSILKPETSTQRAVAILGAKDPAAALDKNENGFVASTEEGGIAPLSGDHADLVSKVQANTNLMAVSGPVSTPGLLFCDKTAGNKTTYIQGYPQDIKGFVSKLSAEGNAACSK